MPGYSDEPGIAAKLGILFQVKHEKDHYAILQLPGGSSIEQIRDHYRRLAKIFHPDRNEGDPWCQERLKELNAAFAFLSDPERKAAYDASLKSAEPMRAVREAASIRPRTPSGSAAPGRPRSAASSGRKPPVRSAPVKASVFRARPMSEPFPFAAYNRRPVWAIAAGCASLLVFVATFGYSAIRQDRSGGAAGVAIHTMHQMGILPNLHTGLMTTLHAGGPGEIEHTYRDQLDVASYSARTELHDALDTMRELEARGRPAVLQPSTDATVSATDAPRADAPGASARLAMEGRLDARIEALRSSLYSASSSIDRFDWTTPGVRRRLRASSIDGDLAQVDEDIEPLHQAVCDAQALLMQRDPLSPQSAPPPPAAFSESSAQVN